MRNALLCAVVAIWVTSFYGCKKCYTCVNACEVCTKVKPDTTYTITVCSNTFGQQYYNDYIDSLHGLNWVCRDTTSNYQQKFCFQPGQVNGDLDIKKDAGLYCSPQ